MAFELIFHYTDKETSEKKQFKKVVGKVEEDTPLEQVLNAIVLQMASRQKLVEEVEIYEYVRKRVNFKETKTGYIIRDRRFSLSGDFELPVEDVPVAEPVKVAEPVRNMEPVRNLEPVKISEPVKSPEPVKFEQPVPQHASRHEIFDGDRQVAAILAKRNIFLTPRKKYPILQEKTVVQRVNTPGGPTEMIGYNYVVVDDMGRQVEVSSSQFVPETRLSGPNPYEDKEEGANLSFMGKIDTNMPVLRRGA